jgi:hypothetical protein
MFNREPERIRVPGGSVAAEIRGSHFGAVILATSGPGNVWQDVVVRDEQGQEFYREGPLDGIRIGGAVARVAAEIRGEGIGTFIRRQKIENAQLGPVVVPSGELRFPYFRYLSAWVGPVFRRKSQTW